PRWARLMGAWSRGRVALIGDAAFCPSLLAGQGAALAMISAYVLAGELGKCEGRPEIAFARNEQLLRASRRAAGCRLFRAEDAARSRFTQPDNEEFCAALRCEPRCWRASSRSDRATGVPG